MTADDANGPGLKIYRGLEDDDNFIGRSNLETIMREIVYSNTSETEFAEGASDSVEFVVIDKDGAPSNENEGVAGSAFTSSVALLNAPAVEVKATTIEAGSDFETLGGVVDQVTNVLTMNADASGASLFFANQLTVDLSTATIRSDGVRYKYDPSLTSDGLALNKAQHVDIRELGGDAGATTTTIIGLSDENVILVRTSMTSLMEMVDWMSYEPVAVMIRLS